MGLIGAPRLQCLVEIFPRLSPTTPKLLLSLCRMDGITGEGPPVVVIVARAAWTTLPTISGPLPWRTATLSLGVSHQHS